MPVKTERGALKIGAELPPTQDFDFSLLPTTYDPPPATLDQARAFFPSTGTDLLYDSSIWKDHMCLAIPASYSNLVLEDPQFGSQLLKIHLDWAQHCGAWSVVVPGPRLPDSSQASMDGIYHIAGLLRTIDASRTFKATGRLFQVDLWTECANGEFINGWHIWNKVRSVLGPLTDVKVALRLTHYPESQHVCTPIDIARWCAEPVAMVIAPAKVFLLNDTKQKVLPKLCRILTEHLIQRHARICLGAPEAESDASFFPSVAEYFRYIWKSLPPLTPGELSRLASRDYVQVPLQPLTDDLENDIYECFEADHVKYSLYKQAVSNALKMRKSKNSHNIVLLGGGRGPIMDQIIQAIHEYKMDKTEATFTLSIVEKNLNVFKILQYRANSDPEPLWRTVKLVLADMRQWKPDSKIDIIVSELLGSFGDNELCPECLDGVEGLLAPDGICIPSSYTSYVEPVSCHQVYRDCMNTDSSDSTYVVSLYSHYELSFEGPTPLFTFNHPNKELGGVVPSDNNHNARYKSLEFIAKSDCLCHGFAGYFSCDLAGVKCSIVPQEMNENLSSWYSLFIPLSKPLQIKEGQIIRLHFWRRTNKHAVWYEWCLSEPVATPLQNVLGAGQSLHY